MANSVLSSLQPIEIAWSAFVAVKCGSLNSYAVDESCNTFIGEKMVKIFNGLKTAKLGTEKKPAIVNVQTEQRLKEVASIFEEKGWKYTIGLEPDRPEDITNLEILLKTIYDS